MHTLAEYLRIRRARLSPADVGLVAGGSRRVPGLRRQEVAQVAGLSVDYYTRLEQGREKHPSPAVLRAIARVLQVGPDGERYLFSLARETPTPRLVPQVGPNLRDLLADWDRHPAVVLNACNDVLAANRLGTALFGDHPNCGNLARFTFLGHPAGFYRDWDQVAAACVAGLRATAADDPLDPVMDALVEELSAGSAQFRELWARGEVRYKTTGAFRISHPVVGDLDLVYETFRPNSVPGALLKVYRAEPASQSADRLLMLRELTARLPAQPSVRVAT